MMANKTMHHLVIEDNNYEILDAKNRANIAAEYSASSTYNVGDVVLYNGQLYKCTTAIATAEAWTAAHWTAVTVGEKVADLEATTNDLKEDITQVIDSAYVTDTASGSIASFPDGAAMPVKSLTVDIEPVQSGSGDPSPTNVRPITGHTSAVVTRCGKNLLAKPFAYYSETSATVDDCFFVKAGQYIFHFDTTSATSWRFGIRLMDKDGNFLSDSGHNPASGLFYNASVNVWINGANVTIKEIPLNIVDDCYIRIVFANGDTSASTTVTGAQLEIGSTATDYEPYQGQTVTIALGGTIYGGTLNVGTGVLTVDRAIVDMGTLQWYAFITSTFGFTLLYAPISGLVAHNGAKGACSTYKMLVGNYTWNDLGDKQCVLYVGANEARIGVRDSSYTDATAFASAVSGQTVVYELAEPFEVTLTAQEVRTLLGANNVFADCGDVSVEYRADTKLYINKVLNA